MELINVVNLGSSPGIPYGKVSILTYLYPPGLSDVGAVRSTKAWAGKNPAQCHDLQTDLPQYSDQESRSLTL